MPGTPDNYLSTLKLCDIVSHANAKLSGASFFASAEVPCSCPYHALHRGSSDDLCFVGVSNKGGLVFHLREERGNVNAYRLQITPNRFLPTGGDLELLQKLPAGLQASVEILKCFRSRDITVPFGIGSAEDSEYALLSNHPVVNGTRPCCNRSCKILRPFSPVLSQPSRELWQITGSRRRDFDGKCVERGVFGLLRSKPAREVASAEACWPSCRLVVQFDRVQSE